jgi:hypothetical protein
LKTSKQKYTDNNSVVTEFEKKVKAVAVQKDQPYRKETHIQALKKEAFKVPYVCTSAKTNT